MTSETTPEIAALRDLHRVVTLVHSGKDLATVLQAASEGVVEALGFTSAVINLLTPQGDYEAVTCVGPASALLLGSHNDRDEFDGELAIADEWGALRFVPAGRYEQPVGTVVARGDAIPLDRPDAWLPDDALYAPLHDQRGEMMGILSVDMPVNGLRPGTLKRQCLEMYAVQIGLAIAHAREREHMERRVRLATAISTVVHAAAEATDLDDVLNATLDSLMPGFEAELAWIRLFAEEGGAGEAVNYPTDLPLGLHSSAAQAGTYPPLDVAKVFASAERLARLCWKGHRTVVVAEDGQDTSAGVLSVGGRERVLDWLRGIGLDAFVLIPVGAAQDCSGYVVLARRASVGAWSTSEVETSLEVGRELGRVIGLARVREREAQLLRRLEQLDIHKNEMIATVVHELKNPLTSIRGNLELVQDDPQVADRAYSAIAFNVDRMLELVQNMLTLSRLRDPSAELHRGPVDVTALALLVPPLVEIQANRGGVRLDVGGVDEGVELVGNREQLQRLMLNLISNAIKFSEPDSSVNVSLRRDAASVEFTVADHGLGISADDQRHLFEEFHRSSNPQARARPGTGLGLAIVSKIVERHDGQIRVESQLGVGSTFTVVLPVA